MNILEFTKKVSKEAKRFGRYRYVAAESGVSYEWLTKFANGKIPNPTIENVHKLDQFFRNQSNVSTDAAA
jgi:hypothetical protein